MKLHEIPCNANARRAIEVALVQEHSLRFIGNKTADDLADWAKGFGLKAQAVKTCPCGNLGSSLKACICTAGEVSRYHKKHYLDNYDLTIEVREDRSDRVYKMLMGEIAIENEEEMLLRVKQAKQLFKNLGVAIKDLGQDFKDLLKQTIVNLGLTYNQAQTLISLTRSIASLAGDTKLQLSYLAEACQYLSKERT